MGNFVHGVFGLPGSGKTTFLAKYAFDSFKKGVPVYSNFELIGAYKIDVLSDLGKKDIHDCLVLIDEISLVCDCRDWKSFDSSLVYFFTHHRHYNVNIVWASQSWGDADKKIRNLTDKLYHCYRGSFGFCKAYHVYKYLRLENGQYLDGYDESRIPVLYRPSKYGKLFDTHVKRQLAPFDDIKW